MPRPAFARLLGEIVKASSRASTAIVPHSHGMAYER